LRRSLALTLTLLGALALSACGRNGGLEPPPGAAASQPPPAASQSSADGSAAAGTPQDVAAQTGFDARGNPVAPPGPKRSFVLDPLLR